VRRHSRRLHKLAAVVGADPCALLATTAQLLRTHGYELTTTYEIADRAGATEAARDHRFPSKDDIVAALLEQMTRPLLALSVPIATRPEPPEALLWALCYGHTQCHLANEYHPGAVYHLPEFHTERFRTIHVQRAIVRGTYRRLVAALAAPNGPTCADTATRTSLIRALLRSVYPDGDEHVELDAASTGSHIADVALRIAGCPEGAISTARTAAATLLAELEQPS
jgi:AcrR family transcriptional regulator